MSQLTSILNLDLKLRASFPYLKTKIYEITPYNHIIVVPRNQLDAETFKEEFESRWKALTDRVELRNEPPVNAKELPGISNDQIGFNISGVYLNDQSFQTVLEGKFPKLPRIFGMRHGKDHKKYIGFECAPEGDYLDDLNQFLSESLHGLPFEFEVLRIPQKEPELNDQKTEALFNNINALSFMPIHKRENVPEFVKEEEHWWFEKLPDLFSGRISPNSFRFNTSHQEESSCYLHSTIGHQIDIRQLLFTHDVIYMEPPLTDGSNKTLSFWTNQFIDQNDLLTLIEADRVRLIHSQAEERGDLGFLREAKEANPSGVLGRRKTAALMIADIVETADEYLLNSSECYDELFELSRRISEDYNVPIDEIAKVLMFPEYMRRSCMEPLSDRGLMGLMNFGQGELLSETIKRVSKKEVEIESAFWGSAIHTAHMLDATYIPMVDNESYMKSWLEPTKIMGDLLNFYRSFNSRIAPAWAEQERRKVDGQIILPAVPLLSFKDNVTIQDIMNLTQTVSNRVRGHGLISKLSQLPVNEREAQVNKLIIEHSELILKNKKRNQKILYADAAINIGAYATGFNLFPFIPAKMMVDVILKYAKKSPSLDVIISEIELAFEDDLGRNSDLTFMSKISRVAEIKNK